MTKLSNCYSLLPLASSSSCEKSGANSSTSRRRRQNRLLESRDCGNGENSTARKPHELRRLVLETSSSSVVVSDNNGDSSSSASSTTTGSASVEIGYTKVMCQVLAPVPASSDHLPSSAQLSMEEGTLVASVKYAAFGYSTTQLVASTVSAMDTQQQSNQQYSQGRINATILQKEADLSSKLSAALSAVVPMQQYKKCAIVLKLVILQDDGGVLPACITAACLALADAAVELLDLVSCCTVAVFHQHAGQDEKEDKNNNNNKSLFVADPTLSETMAADAIMTLAILPNWKDVTLWEQSGRLSPECANQAMELCRDGCRTMHRFMRAHLLMEQQHHNMNEIKM